VRPVETHVPPDRAFLRELAAELQRELLRLEVLFQSNFRELANETAAADDAEVRKLCDNFYGIAQFSRLTGDPGSDEHIPLRAGSTALPRPVLGGGSPPPGANSIVLPAEEASPAGDAPGFGWFTPGEQRFWVLWRRIGAKEVIAFLIDREETISRVNFGLQDLLQKRPGAGGGLYMVEAPEEIRLAGLEKAPPGREPDIVLPLVCRFGDWQVAGWNQHIMHTAYDPGTLALASTIAAILGILSFILFFQQRAAVRQAEQRVSFVNGVSHELGTPLTNILLNLDLIESKASALPETAQRRLRLVREEAQRLVRLVSNVLTFSRSERGRLLPAPAALVPDEIIDSVLQQFQPALERRGIVLDWNGNANERCRIDGDALAQITSNLVSNVEKYAANGKRLDIESRMEGGELIVRVCDHGPGIPRSHATRIFEPFERVDSRLTEGATGAGLGLSIARELAHSIGGELRLVASAEGATFELRVPTGKGGV
jgi:signal transduction histidine kinase